MMSEQQQAFPRASSEYEGMMLHDWFAGLAMQAITGTLQPANDPSAIAEIAFDIAEAMMSERARRHRDAVTPAGREDQQAAQGDRTEQEL